MKHSIVAEGVGVQQESTALRLLMGSGSACQDTRTSGREEIFSPPSSDVFVRTCPMASNNAFSFPAFPRMWDVKMNHRSPLVIYGFDFVKVVRKWEDSSEPARDSPCVTVIRRKYPPSLTPTETSYEIHLSLCSKSTLLALHLSASALIFVPSPIL